MTEGLDIIKNYLDKVQLPGRYLGTELNRYEEKEGEKRFLLCFPDDYTIAMSSLGFHTVGKIINDFTDFSVERCCAPATDMEEQIRKNDSTLLSLEYKRKASDFDIIGFSFHYELSYTNYINMMDLFGLSPFRSKRREDDPVIIAGGPICVNTAILGEFADIIFVGESEENLPELLSLFDKNTGKKDFLKECSIINGVYIPTVSESVKIKTTEKIESKYHPVDFPVSLVDIPHNRINIEINRGCKNKCRFCQASAIYSPYRERSSEEVLKLTSKCIASTGHDEISLTSLSATDHDGLFGIMDEIYDSFSNLGVSVMLSSMRPGIFTEGIAQRLSRMRKGGITFAPETASNKLKKIIGKSIDNLQILNAAKTAADLGWKKIKLYFLVGLPGETEEDIDDIISFIKEVKKISGLNLNVTINPLSPQSHTPFQWLKNTDLDIIENRINRIRKETRVNIKTVNFKQYVIETILSRGNSKLAQTIYEAWKKGARFDQWNEQFSFGIWESAFKETGAKWEEYYYTDFETLEELPWDKVEVNISKEELKNSYRKAMSYL